MLTFIEGGTPSPGKFCALDPPDDFFRIRLVCTLLETCGMCFDRGSSKKKLDFFLTFFQVGPAPFSHIHLLTGHPVLHLH